ncbi:MAG: hypothetical protein GX601_19180 [Anaerolineales bacterium]|nr:hypothetical protein [Anaerolineales bacterium]
MLDEHDEQELLVAAERVNEAVVRLFLLLGRWAGGPPGPAQDHARETLLGFGMDPDRVVTWSAYVQGLLVLDSAGLAPGDDDAETV